MIISEKIFQLIGLARQEAKEIVDKRKYDSVVDYRVSFEEQSYNKLVELVISECVVALAPNLEDENDVVTTNDMIDKLKKHFGVEEDSVQFVSKFYDVSEEDACSYYSDEIEAFSTLTSFSKKHDSA